MSPTSHYSPPNQGERGRLLIFQEILLEVMRELDICPRPATLHTEEEIVGVTVQDMGVVLEISTTIPCSILKKVFMALGEVDISIGTALLLPIIQLIMAFTTQGFLRNIFQGMCMEKISIKIIRIVLIQGKKHTLIQ